MAMSGAKLAGQLTCRMEMAETKTPRRNQRCKSKMRTAEEKLTVGKINDGEHHKPPDLPAHSENSRGRITFLHCTWQEVTGREKLNRLRKERASVRAAKNQSTEQQ
jgi:hypothetical protein